MRCIPALSHALQAVEKVSSTYLNGLANARYMHFEGNASVQRAKELFAEVNSAQREAVQKVLMSAAAAEADCLMSLLEPIFEVSHALRARHTEEAEFKTNMKEQLGVEACVVPVRVNLGKVVRIVKVTCTRHGHTSQRKPACHAS